MIKLNIIDDDNNHIAVADIKKLSMLIQNKSNYNASLKNMWNEYVPYSGLDYFQIKCSGMTSDKKSGNLLLRYAFENFIFKYEFIFDESTIIISNGKIDSYEKTFKCSEVDEFSMVILNSGKVEMV